MASWINVHGWVCMRVERHTTCFKVPVATLLLCTSIALLRQLLPRRDVLKKKMNKLNKSNPKTTWYLLPYWCEPIYFLNDLLLVQWLYTCEKSWYLYIFIMMFIDWISHTESGVGDHTELWIVSQLQLIHHPAADVLEIQFPFLLSAIAHSVSVSLLHPTQIITAMSVKV